MSILRIIHILIKITEIILEFSDSVVMQKKHTMSRILHNFLAT